MLPQIPVSDVLLQFGHYKQLLVFAAEVQWLQHEVIFVHIGVREGIVVYQLVQKRAFAGVPCHLKMQGHAILNSFADSVTMALAANATGASTAMPLLADDVFSLKKTVEELLPARHFLVLRLFEIDNDERMAHVNKCCFLCTYIVTANQHNSPSVEILFRNFVAQNDCSH